MFSQKQNAILNLSGSNVIVNAADPRTIDPTYGNGTYLWFKTSAGTDYPAGTLFFMYNGVWATPHPLPADSISFLPTGKVIADIGNYDGGVSTDAITDTTGPFWEEVTQMKGRFPLHPDSSSTNPGDTGGAATHPITIDELPAHSHQRNTDGKAEVIQVAGASLNVGFSVSGTPLTNQYTVTGETGGGIPMPILPPYYAIPLIRRTARIYRTA